MLVLLYLCFQNVSSAQGKHLLFHVPLGLRTKQWQRLKCKNLPAGICFHSFRRFRLQELCPSTCVTIRIWHLHPLLALVVSCLDEEAARVRTLETTIGHHTMNIFQWGRQKKVCHQPNLHYSRLLILPSSVAIWFNHFWFPTIIRPLGTSSTSIKW